MIPQESYSFVYYHVVLAFILFTVLCCVAFKKDLFGGTSFQILGWLFFLFVIFYIGLRPISGYYFGDMGTYARNFQSMQESGILVAIGTRELLFSWYVYSCSSFMNVNNWFLLTAALYVGMMALAFRLVHKNYAYIAFLMCVASFSFWSYGTNGIQNGLATSMVLLGMACCKKKWLMAALFLLAFGVHHSTLIPIAAFVVTFFYNKPLSYLIIYMLASVLSAVMGGWWENFFANLGLMQDDRIAQYLLEAPDEDMFSHTGFRLDFFLYSLWPIAMGAYYIFKKKYRDPFYLRLFNTYIMANAFWVLVIRANFSNRIAYLSWFMMSWVIIYPLLKEGFLARQNAVIARTLLCYFAFTYLMFWIKETSL